MRGILDLDNPPRHPLAVRPSDNTNQEFLQRSPLFPYVRSLGVWHYPSDRSTRTIDGQRYPRVRS